MRPAPDTEHPSATSYRLARELLALRGIEPPANIDLGPIPDFDDDEAHAVWVRDRFVALIAEHHAQVAPPNTAA